LTMKEYHKIQTIFKRDEATNFKTLLEGEYSLPEFEYLKNNEWVWTEKIDGTNIRVMWDGADIILAGKTDNATIPNHLLKRLASLFDTWMFKEKFGEGGGVCLYGEGYGAKIQKAGPHYINNNVDFILFDCRVGQWWLTRDSLLEIVEYFHIGIVPIIGSGTLGEAIEHCRAGFKSVVAEDKDLNAEGLVLKPSCDLFARNGSRIITKIKTKDFIS